MDQIIALVSGAIFISLIICGFGVKKIGLYRPEIFITRDWEFDHVPNAFYFLFRSLWCSLMWNTAYHSRCKSTAFRNEKSSHIQHKENNFSSQVELSVQIFCGNLQVVHLSNTISSERLSLQKAKSRLEVFFQVHNITEFVAKIFSKLDSKTQNLMVVQYCTKLLSTPVHMMLVLNTMNSWPPRAANVWSLQYLNWSLLQLVWYSISKSTKNLEIPWICSTAWVSNQAICKFPCNDFLLHCNHILTY
jgi:hypothetical protein